MKFHQWPGDTWLNRCADPVPYLYDDIRLACRVVCHVRIRLLFPSLIFLRTCRAEALPAASLVHCLANNNDLYRAWQVTCAAHTTVSDLQGKTMRILQRSVITSEDPFCSDYHPEHKADGGKAYGNETETSSVTIYRELSDRGDILV